MTNTELTSISLDNLALVQGGVTRQDFQNFGGQAAEVGVVAGGAAVGTALGGPGGAAVGAVGAEVLNRTGVSKAAGEYVGGKVYDAGAAVGRGVSNAYNGARSALGY
jgi:hypothetical protein